MERRYLSRWLIPAGFCLLLGAVLQWVHWLPCDRYEGVIRLHRPVITKGDLLEPWVFSDAGIIAPSPSRLPSGWQPGDKVTVIRGWDTGKCVLDSFVGVWLLPTALSAGGLVLLISGLAIQRRYSAPGVAAWPRLIANLDSKTGPIIAISVVAAVLTPVGWLFGVMWNSGHGTIWMPILTPYSGLVALARSQSAESTVMWLSFAQFPFYGYVLDWACFRGVLFKAALGLLLCHTLAIAGNFAYGWLHFH